MTANEYLEPAPKTWHVGKREPGSVFYANPYLRTFESKVDTNPKKQFNLIIDPGSSSDFAVVRNKVSQVIGGLQRLTAVFINHQDPDVGSSASVILGRFANKAAIVTSEETWRLVHHQNLPKSRFVDTRRHASGLKLPTGHKVIPVPSPFCHFVGAVMLFDPETGVLFSGDLFGGLTDSNATGIWADETDWTGMRAFHQLYMPSSEAIRYTIEKIRDLEGLKMIAPQHGRVLQGDLMWDFMSRLERLEVGVEILEDREADKETLQAWTTVLGRLLDVARNTLGQEAESRLVSDSELADRLIFDGSHVGIKELGRATVERAVRALTLGEPPKVANLMKYEAVLGAEELMLPVPRIDIEEVADDNVTTAWFDQPNA